MNDLCRTCLRSPQKLLNLDNRTELIEKIETIASIKVIMHVSLPNSVCEECVSNINKLYNLRKVIKNSDLELKERLQALENTQLAVQNTDVVQIESMFIKSETNEDDNIECEREMDNQNEMNDLCRTCLRSPQKLLNLDNSTELIEKIETIASIKVIMHVNLSNSICEECVSNINKLYNFRKVIKNSDLELKERLQALENTQLAVQNTDLVPVESMFIKSEFNEDNNMECETEMVNQNEMLENPIFNTISESENSSFCIYNPKSYHCKSCNITCTGYLAWKRHQRSAHFECVTCNICGKTMKKENIVKHEKRHAEGRAKQTVQNTNIEQAKNEFKKVEIGVENNDVTDYETSELKEHVEFLEDVNIQNTYVEQTGIELVTIKVEENGTDIVECETKVDNQNEVSDFPNASSYKCEKCNFTCTDHLLWTRHRRSAHSELDTCNICGKTMKKYNLHNHIKNHSNGHVCNECGESFKNYDNLRKHAYRQHKRVEIHCEICGKIFHYHGDLNCHMKYHLGNSPKVPCAVCGKNVQKKYMKRHIRTHTGERSYPCQYCNKSFFNSSAVKRHTLLHTKEKPFVCEYCPGAFTQKISLQLHIKSKHLKKY